MVDAQHLVLGIVSQEYNLRFTDIPGTFHIQDNRSARDHADFVQNATNV